MTKLVQKIVDGCVVCQRNKKEKAPRTQVTPLEPPSEPFERWGMDFIGRMPVSESGNKWILVAIDHFSKWPIAKAVPEASAKTVVEFIKENLVASFGIPKEIITDRGTAFTAMETETYLKETLGTRHLRTSAYHPQANGVTERFNGLLGSTLRKITEQDPNNWDKGVHRALLACRARRHEATKASPFEVLFGKRPAILKRDTIDEGKQKTPDMSQEEARESARVNLKNQKKKMEQIGEPRIFK
ncbi:MAG: uncharacterized protein A8A55_3346, partial [Amphiamblys sp. WSBS2006]